MNEFPSISVVLPTYNSETVLRDCLESIRRQDYPREKVEIIVADAGSTDNTLKIAREFKVDKLVSNPLKTGEAGKAVGVKAAGNEIVALIDSDNILDGGDWFRKMIEPFQDPEIVASEPLYYTYRKEDGYITRYCALLGMNDPLCLFLGNYDRFSTLTGKWTEMPHKEEDKGDYLKIELDEKRLPTMGANGFLIRRSALLSVFASNLSFPDYLFDIDVICKLLNSANSMNTINRIRFAKVKTGIVHTFSGDLRTFAKKQRRRIRDYLFYNRLGSREYPWKSVSRAKLLRFVLACVTVFPLLAQSIKGYLKKPDNAWFLHPLACYLTLWEYGLGRVAGIFGVKEFGREEWGAHRKKGKPGVMVLSPFYEPNVGGVETHLKDLTELLRKENKYKVFVLTYQPICTKAKGPIFEKYDNVEITRIPWIGFNLFRKLEPYPILEFLYVTPWLFIWTFVFLMFKGKNIKTVHAQGFNASFIARVLAKAFGKAFVSSTHAIYEMNSRPLMARLARWVLEPANKVLALSDASRRELTGIGLREDKVDTYTYWVDQETFKPTDKAAAKRSVGWEGKFVVLFVGRFIDIKGMDVLLKVAERIDEEIHFAFIGDGPMSARVEQASRRLNNVVFLGKIDNRNLPLYYSGADILCVPSKYEEGLGRVILEALSCGTPVVASNKGGIPEVIDQTVGVLIDPTVNDLSREIVCLYRASERLHEMQSCCREYAVNRFSDKNAELIVRCYGD